MRMKRKDIGTLRTKSIFFIIFTVLLLFMGSTVYDKRKKR